MHHTEYDKARGSAVSKVMEFIHVNLSEDLSLEKLASVANYSPFHFQRLFSEKTGETPKKYVIRLRLERAAHYLKVFSNLSISEIAENSGFSSLSTFSRAFAEYFSISPALYRLMPSNQFRKIGKTNSKISKIIPGFSADLWHVEISKDEMERWNRKMKIEVSRKQGFDFVYANTFLSEPDGITKAFQRLTQWAAPRNLISEQTKFIGVLIDIPFITSLEKCRYWAGLSLQPGMMPVKEMSCSGIKSGLHAIFSMKGNLHAVLKNLVLFSHGWLSDSGYALKDITGYEVFSENPAYKPLENIQRQLHIPVRSL